MDAVREVALSFCAAAVVSSAIALLGGGRLQKSLSYIIALMLICTVISAVQWGEAPELPEYEDSETTYRETELCEYQAEYMIAQILKEKGLSYEKIALSATKTEEDSIIISKIELYGVADRQGVQAAMREYGIDAEVIFR